MANLIELLDKKARAKKVCDDLLIRSDAGTPLTPDEDKQFDAAAAEVDQCDVDIARQIKVDDMDRREAALAKQLEKRSENAGSPATDVFPAGEDNKEYRKVFEKLVLRGFNTLTPEEVTTFNTRNAELQKRGTDTQQAGDDGLGGFSVPTLFDTTLIRVMKAFSGIMNVGSIFNTNTGATIMYPKIDSTAQKGAIIGENDTDIVKDFNIGQLSLGAKTFTSRIIKVSKQLLHDSFLNFDSEVIAIAAERIARYAEEVFTVGGGGITGLIPAAATGHTSVLTNMVSYDDMIDLQHSVNSAYRAAGKYMFNDNTLKAIRKLKDGDGRPMWVPSLTAGVANMFAGKAYQINTEMADMAVDAKAIAFGDFSKYKIRMVNDRELVILREKYAEQRAIGFNIFQRMDAVLVDTNAIKVMVNAAA